MSAFDELLKQIEEQRELYPITVVATRYGGSYEGGLWAAFNARPWEVPTAAMGDDIACMTWWSEENKARTGLGFNPDAAVADLKQKLGYEN